MDSNVHYFEVNRQYWDEATEIHLRGSETYPIEVFKAGKSMLPPSDIEEVGDVTGKSMLHLQCHFGMDTLSWARLGAAVTGVDFSEKAVDAARSLSREIDVPADFICCNIYDLPHHLQGQFDIVYSSYGVLYWLPDLSEWARTVSRYLKEGGFFYLADGHPFWDGCIEETEEGARLEGDYFATGRAHRSEPGFFDYANEDVKSTVPEYGWRYTVSGVLNTLIQAGLTIAFFNEYAAFDPEDTPAPYPKKFSLKALK